MRNSALHMSWIPRRKMSMCDQKKTAAEQLQAIQTEQLLQPSPDHTMYTVMRIGEQYLQECGLEDASIDAWLLMEYVTGITRTRFLIERSNRMPLSDQQRYFELLQKRGGHIPLQHLTGVQEFMGFTFQVNEHVLIPRQDTELLVEEALKRIQSGMRILDLCTGSGCIAISLALLAGTGRMTGKLEAYQGENKILVDASDLSGEALEVAARNVASLDADVSLIQGDLFEAVTRTYHMIVSNPPYIPTAVICELSEEVRNHDPFSALDGKEDGLYFYRKIVEEAPDYLEDGGYLLFEIGHDQGASVSTLMLSRGFQDVQVYKDLAGMDRVAAGSWTK